MNITDQQTESEALIRSLLDERIQAIYNKNMEAVLAMYAEDVVTFDLKEPLQNKGCEKLKTRLQEWFATYKSPITQELKELEIVTADSVAFSHCLTRTYGTSGKDEKQDMWYRTTTGFKKIDGKWLIFHEHISEPIDMHNGMALFDLQP